MAKKTSSLTGDDLLKVERIVLDRDKEEALDFIREAVKKRIDREDASKMKREGVEVKHEKKSG
ncbi:MAG: hypothetical protein PHH75_07280 [Candidatus Omnitrophica bacterium]|nr:hypothetical protein [Candidatus Omnitrophota bacterium]MDD5574962.1 hypothetical protein [Candidatus Omnitrophota bacterium]